MIRLSRSLLAAACAALLASCAKTSPAPGGLGDPCVANADCATGFLCAAGRCVLPANLGGCEPARKRCNGSDVEVCGADGLGWSLVTACPTGCSGGACRPQACSPGARRCEGDAAEACTPSGDAWALVQICPSHCDATTGQCKAPLCTPFSARCDPSGANAVLTCDSFGAAYASTPCGSAKVCDGGRCLDVICTPSQTRCSINSGSVETCNDKGDAFTSTSSCQFGCASTGSGASCAPSACAANASRCNGSAIERCRPDQTGWSFVAFCATGCTPPTASVGAQCTAPLCAPSARRCSAGGGGTEVCTVDGTAWAPDLTCPQGCAGGQCVTSSAGCLPGDLRCNGPDAQACAQVSPGVTQWKTAATCLAGCSSGACAPGGSCASLKLNAAVSSVPIDGKSSVLVYSEVVVGADGATMPDGTAFTVAVSVPAGSPLPGLATADATSSLPGVQVKSLAGRIHFALTAPSTAPGDFTATATATLVGGASCTASTQVGFTSAGAGQTILVAEDFSGTALRNLPATTADWNTEVDAVIARWPAPAGAGEDGTLCLTTSAAQAATPTCPAWTVIAPGASYNLTTSYAPAFQVLGLAPQSASLDAVPQGLSGGDEVLLWNAQGSSAGFANAGAYEFLHVATVDGSTVTFAESVRGTYGAVADQNVGLQRVQLVRVPHFKNVVVLTGAKLTANGWNGAKGGALAMRVSGTATIQGEVLMDGAGYRGGASGNSWGEDQTAFPSLASSASIVGAGAGGPASGGGFGTPGGGASAGQAYGLPLIGRLFLGAGGGGSASGPSTGTAGGGAILISAGKLALSADGTSASAAQGRIHADGVSACILGGQGAGGTVWVSAIDLTVGTGGSTNQLSGRGGAPACSGPTGGNGRVRIDFQTSSDANSCARAAGSCTLGVAGPLQAQSLDAYAIQQPSSLSLKSATLVLALGAPATAVFQAAAADVGTSANPDFGTVSATGVGPCPAPTAATVCFVSGSTPQQGPRFRWRVQLSPQPGDPQSVQALQWSLKAQ